MSTVASSSADDRTGMRWYHDPAALRFVAAAYLPWLGGLSLVWEIAQLPLYTIVSEREWWYVAYAVAHCTVGDVVIGGLSLVCALVVVRAGPRSDWCLIRIAAMTAAIAVAYTGLSEWTNVHLLQWWRYAPAMPVVNLGEVEIGVSPILQWIVTPSVALGLAMGRRQLSDPRFHGAMRRPAEDQHAVPAQHERAD